jgi:hypothetical protein
MKKYRLPKAFTEKWLEALRSGDYPQGKDWLFDGEGYCCLGVACMLIGHIDVDLLEGHSVPSEIKEALVGKEFPQELLTDPDAQKVFNPMDADLIQNLMAFNDGYASWSSEIDLLKRTITNRDINVEKRKYTFAEIADWIEQNVELY